MEVNMRDRLSEIMKNGMLFASGCLNIIGQDRDE